MHINNVAKNAVVIITFFTFYKQSSSAKGFGPSVHFHRCFERIYSSIEAYPEDQNWLSSNERLILQNARFDAGLSSNSKKTSKSILNTQK
jgi:hypothetical protein